MDRGYHISMFFNKSVPGFHLGQNPWISSKIYPSQTMPFDQIWPDLGFLWIGVSYFNVFQQICSRISFYTKSMDFIQNLPFTDHAFCSDLARPWIHMDWGYHIQMFFNKSVPGFHFRQNPWISCKIYPSQTMPFDQIWPDLGFLWIGGIIFQCFATNLFQDFTLHKIYRFLQKSTLPRSSLLLRSGQTLNSYG